MSNYEEVKDKYGYVIGYYDGDIWHQEPLTQTDILLRAMGRMEQRLMAEISKRVDTPTENGEKQ